MSALPKQVRQQIAEAKRIEGELRAAAAETPPVADPVTPPVSPETSPQPAEPAPAAPVTPAASPQPEAEAQYAELLHQHRTLQGIHRTLANSNGELQSQVKILQAQVQNQAGELERLTQKPITPPLVAPVTPEEIKEFGPDLISVIERKAREVAAPLNEALERANVQIDRLSARNTELEQSLNGVSRQQAQIEQDTFEADLLRLVPDFNALNNDKRFLSWLSQVDPLDARRRTLKQRLDEAVNVGDAQAVASYFATFRTLLPAAPAATRPNLAQQAQPASRAAPDTAPKNTGKIWAQADISQFYADIARGKYSAAEKTRIEREIFAAQKDNRIAA